MRIEPYGRGYRVFAYGYPDDVAQALIRPPFPWSRGVDEAVSPPTDTAGAGRHARPAQASATASPKDVGKALFEGAFRKDIAGLLRRSLARAEHEQRTLRLRLWLSRVPALSHLPWEYLFDPERRQFLAHELSIVRELPMSTGVRPVSSEAPFRVLVVRANPPGTPALATGEETQILKRTLGDSVDFLSAATLEALAEQLQKAKYTALHFIGHGSFHDGEAEGILLFEENAGGAHPVGAHRLATMLANRGIRLVVLNACEGGRHARFDPWSGVAQELLAQGIPAVIAMQAEITDQAALFFAERFYRAFVERQSIDYALMGARRDRYVEHGGDEWGTPVLYSSERERRLFSPPTFLRRARAWAKRRRWSLAVAFAVVLAAVVWSLRDPWPPSRECPSPPGLGLRFRKVGPGSALLGGTHQRDAPQHTATIPELCMGQMEVTRWQWRQVMGSVPGQGEDDRPVTDVTWHQVQSFLAALNRLDGKARFRLPTEEQWEYAARADSLDLAKDKLALYANCGGRHAVGLLPVGRLKPNAFGLFDMSGNVREWVDDLRSETDGTLGAIPAETRIIRGGGYKSGFETCRPAARDWNNPEAHAGDLGFRIVRDPLSESSEDARRNP